MASEREVGVLWAMDLVDEVRGLDDVVVLHKGRVLATGRASDIIAQQGATGLLPAFESLIGKVHREPDRAMTVATASIENSSDEAPRLSFGAYALCLYGIIWREMLRFLHQRGRFLSALVRPLVWLFIFAAGFRATLGVSIIPPYDTYVLYEVYITPGLVAMI